jgi:hypothetical protein
MNNIQKLIDEEKATYDRHEGFWKIATNNSWEKGYNFGVMQSCLSHIEKLTFLLSKGATEGVDKDGK